MRFVEVAGHAQGGAADGEDGETIGEELLPSQDGALQASSQENQADDPERQASSRADEASAAQQPLFLVMRHTKMAFCLKNVG